MVEVGGVNKVWIPMMSGERLSELAQRIKPLVHFNGEGLCYIKWVHPHGTYLHDPEPDVAATNIKTLCDITTFHTFGYRIYFNPTVAEVLKQIPPEHIDKVVAFEIVSDPTKADESNWNYKALDAGYHAATTRLYARKE